MTKRDIDINKALFKASTSGNLKEVQEAIKMHADVNAKDKAGWTPLHFASARGQDQIVAQLINNGADVNVEARINRWTPLWLAQQNNYNDDHRRVIDMLESQGGKAI